MCRLEDLLYLWLHVWHTSNFRIQHSVQCTYLKKVLIAEDTSLRMDDFAHKLWELEEAQPLEGEIHLLNFLYENSHTIFYMKFKQCTVGSEEQSL